MWGQRDTEIAGFIGSMMSQPSVHARLVPVSLCTGSHCDRCAVPFTCTLHGTLKGSSRQMHEIDLDGWINDAMKIKRIEFMELAGKHWWH